jgi:hypothetical protein
MPESGSSGSGRGALGNGCPYRKTRAASILPSRPQFSQPLRAGPVKAGRVFAATL